MIRSLVFTKNITFAEIQKQMHMQVFLAATFCCLAWFLQVTKLQHLEEGDYCEFQLGLAGCLCSCLFFFSGGK